MDVKIEELVNQIDLELIVYRMVKVCKWSNRKAKEVSEQYKRFLCLRKKYGDVYDLPPSEDIDEFWHNHILYTLKYHQDCLTVFGRYLHHHPQSVDKIQKAKLQKKFEDETQRLYFVEYGDYLYQV